MCHTPPLLVRFYLLVALAGWSGEERNSLAFYGKISMSRWTCLSCLFCYHIKETQLCLGSHSLWRSGWFEGTNYFCYYHISLFCEVLCRLHGNTKSIVFVSTWVCTLSFCSWAPYFPNPVIIWDFPSIIFLIHPMKTKQKRFSCQQKYFLANMSQCWVAKHRTQCVEKPVVFLAVVPGWPSQLWNTRICTTVAPVGNRKNSNKGSRMSLRFCPEVTFLQDVLHERACSVCFQLSESVFYFRFLINSQFVPFSYCQRRHKCGSEVWVGRPSIRKSAVRSPAPLVHVDVTMGKTLHPPLCVWMFDSPDGKGATGLPDPDLNERQIFDNA